MIIPTLVLSTLGWLCMSYVFETGYKAFKPDYHGSIHKYQFCWGYWAFLGALSFVSTGTAGLIQLGLIFTISSGHIHCCCIKEDFISPRELIRQIPVALKNVYERFRTL